MAYTYSKIATYTVGSGGIPSVSFLNIPQNYADLVVKASLRTGTGGIGTYQLKLNESSAGYSERILYGTGSAAGSTNVSSTYFWWAFNTNENGSTASTFASNEIYIPNYTSSNYKSVSSESVTENNAAGATAYLVAGLWSNTEPIRSITFDIEQAALFLEHSTFHLYGIKAEI